MPEQIPCVLTLPTPVKSANDKKDYKCIQLPNGLKALLISDTSYDLSNLDKEEGIDILRMLIFYHSTNIRNRQKLSKIDLLCTLNRAKCFL